MDNENKELEELTTQEPETVTENEITEQPDVVEENEITEQPESAAEDAEFDPTESEDFYNNLEAAIGTEDDLVDAELPELSLPEDTFVLDETPEQPAEDSMEAEIFAGVDAALSEQIEQEFGSEEETGVTEEKPNKFVAAWKAIPTWTKVLVGVVLALLISLGLLLGTKGGKKFLIGIAVEILLGEAKTGDDEDLTPVPSVPATVSPEPTAGPTPGASVDPTAAPTQNPDATPEPTTDPALNPDITPEPTVDPEATPGITATPTPTPLPVYDVMDDENIINVLLLGEENIYNYGRGRTDSIIVVSINLNGGPLKMISFQRDLYVPIAGKNVADRVNAAYRYGNYKCVVETVEKSFGIDIDGYVKIDFKGFENLIDSLGGLRISLTAKESDYLNTTTYISKPNERNTVAGYQNMTGAQVLGYCRIRKVSTAQGLLNDRGRNYRHRVVLQALFDKFKDQNITQLIKLKDQCMDYVTVSSNITDLVTDALFAMTEHKMYEIDTMQFPQGGQYEGKTVKDSRGDDMDIIVYYPGAVKQLQEFIYGDN